MGHGAPSFVFLHNKGSKMKRLIGLILLLVLMAELPTTFAQVESAEGFDRLQEPQAPEFLIPEEYQEAEGDSREVALLKERVRIASEMQHSLFLGYRYGDIPLSTLLGAADQVSEARLDFHDGDLPRQVEVLKEQLKQCESHVNFVQGRVDTGSLPSAEVLQAKYHHKTVELRLLRLQKKLQDKDTSGPELSTHSSYGTTVPVYRILNRRCWKAR